VNPKKTQSTNDAREAQAVEPLELNDAQVPPPEEIGMEAEQQQMAMPDLSKQSNKKRDNKERSRGQKKTQPEKAKNSRRKITK
jgi:hypothetical protein